MKQTDSGQRGGERWVWWKEGEGISQRTYKNDPWTWAMVWGLTMGVGGGGGQKGEIGTTIIG